jgi:2-oxoglutarate ferredoxin oxidoreductase subunit beta
VLDLNAFKSEIKPTWCPGCGDFAVLNAVMKALQTLQIPPWNTLVVSGIGCSSNFPHFLSAYGFHGIHGRSIPVASGAKLANHELTVIAAGGDGDGYGIGCGHFVHCMRRNLDLTYIVMDNQIYGLTTGQASPTSEMKMKTKSTPEGVIEEPINPIALALGAGATFVSRGFSGDVKGLTEILVEAIKHKGFSLVDVLSPCVTYNKDNTYEWFRSRVYSLAKEGHDPSDLRQAWARATEWPAFDSGKDRIPTGIFYRREGKPTYEELEPGLRAGPLAKRVGGIAPALAKELLAEFY